MKAGTSAGRIPANVLVAARAIVTAGLAKLVDAVNQYAAVMYAPTANGTAIARLRATPQMTESNQRWRRTRSKTAPRPNGRARRPRRGVQL